MKQKTYNPEKQKIAALKRIMMQKWKKQLLLEIFINENTRKVLTEKINKKNKYETKYN